jgi:uncharacterized cupin superfamily protein
MPEGDESARVGGSPLRPSAARRTVRLTEGDVMARLESRNIDSPDETRNFKANGRLDVVTLGSFTLGRGTFEPGWRWSQDVKPIAGTESCMTHHTGICVSGSMTVRSDDGSETTVGPGDVFVLEPGHDAWTVGDEPCVLFDTGVAAYARPAT